MQGMLQTQHKTKPSKSLPYEAAMATNLDGLQRGQIHGGYKWILTLTTKGSALTKTPCYGITSGESAVVLMSWFAGFPHRQLPEEQDAGLGEP